MHDDLLERRLRAALHDEAGKLPFTITAAELERRAALRGRAPGSRRLTLLLAAAVGIVALGVGGLVGGVFDRPTPTPTASLAAVASGEPLPTGPATLPSLDVLLGREPATVLLAQAHGPAGGPAGRSLISAAVPAVWLGTVDGSPRYRITVACLGAPMLELAIRDPDRGAWGTGPAVPCDGQVLEHVVVADGPRVIGLFVGAPASWRIVVRGEKPPVPHLLPEPVLVPADGLEELLRLEDWTIAEGADRWGDSGLLIQEVDGLPTRLGYAVRVWCEAGEDVRFAFGDEIEGELALATETHIACDGRVHDVWLGITEPHGARLYVAARPGTRPLMLIASEPPPVAIAQDQPGWQLSSGFGPHLSFDATVSSITAPGVDGGGPVLIVLACTGEQDIEVTVEVGQRMGDRQETFTAACAPGGATTAQAFEADGSYIDVVFAAPVGAWTALSVLVPDPLPSP